MLYDNENTKYNLEGLAEAATLPGMESPQPRTIRSWIKAGVVQAPDGKGQGKHYGRDHWIQVLFLQQIQKQLDGERLPLKWLAAQLPTIDPGAMERVALGQEKLAIIGAAQFNDSWSNDAEPYSPGPPSETSHASMQVDTKNVRSGRDAEESGPWTTIDVTTEISLRLKGDDPEQVVRLAKMARHLREWTGEEF